MATPCNSLILFRWMFQLYYALSHKINITASVSRFAVPVTTACFTSMLMNIDVTYSRDGNLLLWIFFLRWFYLENVLKSFNHERETTINQLFIFLLSDQFANLCDRETIQDSSMFIWILMHSIEKTPIQLMDNFHGHYFAIFTCI